MPVLVIIAFLFVIKPNDVSKQHDGKKLFGWNKQVDLIEGNSNSRGRSIASVSKPSGTTNRRSGGRVIPHGKFKEQVKKKYKMGVDDSFTYKSIAPGLKSDFINGVSRYKFLDFFYAIKDTPENRKLYPNFEAKLGFIIVQSEVPITGSLPVVENEQTGHFGVFTGIIKAKLKDMNDAEFVIVHNNYQIVQRYDYIRLVQYQIDDVALAIATHQNLLQNPKVERSSLEILEYARSGR